MTVQLPLGTYADPCNGSTWSRQTSGVVRVSYSMRESGLPGTEDAAPESGSQLRLVRGRTEQPLPVADGSCALGVETDRAARRYRLPDRTRTRHLYMTGMPGTGKSTLLLRLIRHDLLAGNGACLLDPHGELIEQVLTTCPGRSDLADRIVVLDVADREHPVGIDLLDTRDPDEQDLVIQFFLGLFSRMYLPEHQGPVLYQAVRNGLLVLMGARRPLAEFPLLFSDESYLEMLLDSDIDPFARRFFKKIWGNMSPFHRGESLAYFTSKFSPFFEDRLTRNILSQRGGLDFDAILADRKVLLINLARGRIGDLSASLLGRLVLHLIRRCAMRRDPATRPPLFNLYVDEAHEFAGNDLAELLTSMRKFAVGVTLANQSIEDFTPSLRETILGSVGTFIVLRQGAGVNAEIESLLQPRFDRRDLMRLPDFTAVLWSSADLKTPPARIRLDAPPRADRLGQAELLRSLSAQRYGRPRAAVEADLLRAVDGDLSDFASRGEEDGASPPEPGREHGLDPNLRLILRHLQRSVRAVRESQELDTRVESIHGMQGELVALSYALTRSQSPPAEIKQSLIDLGTAYTRLLITAGEAESTPQALAAFCAALNWLKGLLG